MNPVRNMKLHAAGAAFLLAATLSAVEPADFPFYKDIDFPGKEQEPISVFNFDAEIYQNLEDMNGFRIYAPDGTLCPFLCDWTISTTTRPLPRQRTVEASIERFEELPGGSVRITVSAMNRGDDSFTGITIRTDAKDFDKKVKVYRGNDLVAEGAFLDYSSRIDLRNDFIAFPDPVKADNFVVVIENYTETKDSPLSRVVSGDTNTVEQYKVREEPKITGITLSCFGQYLAREKLTIETPITVLSQELRDKTTVVKFSNGFAPLGELKVQSSDIFFSRQYRLYNAAGSLVQFGSIRRLDSGVYSTAESERTIDVQGRRSKSWTLELDNGDNGELNDLSLTATGPIHQVRFLSKVPRPESEAWGKGRPLVYSTYRVYYGAVGLPEPENPFADMMQPSRTGTRNETKEYKPDCTLAPQQANTAFRVSSTPRDWSVVYRILMGVAALAVLLILIRSAGHIEKVKD